MPDALQQALLERACVRTLDPCSEQDQILDLKNLITREHYLKNANLVGETLWQVAEANGQLLAVLGWSTAAKHLRLREEWIGWSAEQREARLPLVVNNARFLIPKSVEIPNLASKVMRLALGQLSDAWERHHGHPVVVAESFVDGQLFRGTAYQASAWERLGQTKGFARNHEDYYTAHDRPKQLWVRELRPGAKEQLRAERMSGDLAPHDAPPPARWRGPVGPARSLRERFKAVTDTRARHESFPLCTLLTLLAMAVLCGAGRGQRDLAAFSARLSQGQLKQLGVRRNKMGRYPSPSESTFFRALSAVSAPEVESVLKDWQREQRGEPAADDCLLAQDGKVLRASRGTATVNLVRVRSGQWEGTVGVDPAHGEIPAAREGLEGRRLDGGIWMADAAHTQRETTRQVVQDEGGHYIQRVKGNQEGLAARIEEALKPPGDAAAAIPPSGGGDDDAQSFPA